MTEEPFTAQPPMLAARRVRIGIDVGGTFTDVVVIDHETREVIGHLKVPTTHRAAESVAHGIITAIEDVLTKLSITAENVTFIAHSTTQATNALLEGDVAQVGIIGMGSGLEGWKARRDTRVPPIELAPGRLLTPSHRFLPTGGEVTPQVINHLIEELRRDGAEVIVASEAFGVDHIEAEDQVARLARAHNMLATSGHDVSSLYGLRIRTRTAVLNAAILPKMVNTAEMTAQCVQQAGIRAPLMIMRSDGGVMSVAEVHRRPILTMLSGPAAGIAGALMYERVSDGIFIEVGGTSADISVIRDGQPQIRSARVGGHRTYLHTLDVRTLAIAGGSLVREDGGKIIDVGPRSAHIAGLPYASFAAPAKFDGACLAHLRPTEHDAADYVAIETPSGERFALTPTCAANLLGIVPENSFAKGDAATAHKAFLPLAHVLGVTAEAAAQQVLDISCQKIVKQIEELIREYSLVRATVELVGGGGGAAALVPHAGKLLNLPARIARKAEVISTIGVALAMVRDTVERNIIEPRPEEILAVRGEATAAVIKAGALPETIEVQVEVDTRRGLVRATAFGTTELKPSNTNSAGQAINEEGCRLLAARSMQSAPENVHLAGQTAGLYVFVGLRRARALFGLFSLTRQSVRVTDHTGVILLQRTQAEVISSHVTDVAAALESIITKLTDYGDAGRTLPDLHVLVGRRLVNLSGLADAEQAIALAQVELGSVPAEERVVIVAAPKNV